MNLERLLQSITVIADENLETESDVVRQLVLEGFTTTEAEKYCLLVPLAFGRQLLEKLGVNRYSDLIQLKDNAGEWVVRPLKGDPLFEGACRLAISAFRGEALDDATIQTLATMSWEYHCVNDAMKEGTEVKGAKLSDTMAVKITAEEWDAFNR